MLARTMFTVETAGDFTFQVTTDDGFILRFPDFDFTSGSGTGLLIPAARNEIFQDGTSNPTRGVINLPVGTHELQLLFVENIGSLSAEVAFAPGAFDVTLPEDQRALVGIFIAPPEVPFSITSVVRDDNGDLSITFPSEDLAFYQIEVSTDLANFVIVEEEVLGDPGETLSIIEETDIDRVIGEEPRDRVFIRVREIPDTAQ